MVKKIWRLIIDDLNDPFFNMAADEAIAKSIGILSSKPTLRFYRWNPATLSLGYFQKFNKEINSKYCIENNIGLVRRITGGRAVLHADEITYSVCIPSSDPLFERDLISSYKIIAQALAEGLRSLNLNPSFNQKKLPAVHSSAACFDAPSIYEITVNNKKIIGSAQKRFQHSFLQHGSIPFTIDPDKLFNCFNIENKELKNRLLENFKSSATGIKEELKKDISIDMAIDAFKYGFEKVLNIEFEVDKISEWEKELIDKDLYLKYKSEQWLKKY